MYSDELMSCGYDIKLWTHMSFPDEKLCLFNQPWNLTTACPMLHEWYIYDGPLRARLPLGRGSCPAPVVHWSWLPVVYYLGLILSMQNAKERFFKKTLLSAEYFWSHCFTVTQIEWHMTKEAAKFYYCPCRVYSRFTDVCFPLIPTGRYKSA